MCLENLECRPLCVLPPLVPALDTGLEHLGSKIGSTQHAHQWIAEWTTAYFQGTTRGAHVPTNANSQATSVTCCGGASSCLSPIPC